MLYVINYIDDQMAKKYNTASPYQILIFSTNLSISRNNHIVCNTGISKAQDVV